MKTPILTSRERQSGFALLMVMVLLAISFMVLGATMARTTTNAKLIDRNNAYVAANAAAEAATEKAMALLMSDYQSGSEARVLSNLTTYADAVPTSTESSYWTNFQFSDAQGNTGKNYAQRISVASNAVFTQLAEQYAGLSGFCSTYRVLSNVKPVNSPYGVTGAVQQDVQVAEIPVFQFAIFYNSLMEYTWGATLTVRGRVHCNTNIYVGSSADLTFNYLVTATGIITNPAWAGHTQAQYTGSITYNQTNQTGYTPLTLPIGTNNTPAAVREIINLPATNESVSSPIGQQRYYNNAGMVILVDNSNITVTVKNAPTDPGLSFTNTLVAYTNAGFTNFISTTNLFYDQRDQRMMKTTQIDVGHFKNWLTGTNIVAAGILTHMGSVPLNIVYVNDLRDTNSNVNTAIRLMDGTTLPPAGLTVATPNPLYIWGVYNCSNSANLNTTNTIGTAPSSVVCDALTLLSPNWDDTKAANNNSTLDNSGIKRNAATADTVNTAVIAGIVYSTGSTSTTYSGGVMNLPRLLEDWGSTSLTINTSIVNLYDSVRATRQFVIPGTYYNAPQTRNFNFDQNFTQPGGIPPGTPKIRQIIRSSFCNPPPNSINYNTNNDFVPQ